MNKMAESVMYFGNKTNDENRDINRNRKSGKLRFMEDFTEIFRTYVESSPEFKDALNIAKRNSTGKIWVIGSFVYRNIIKEIYRKRFQKLSEIDIDFLVETHSEKKVYVPQGWELRMSDWPHPYFLKKEGGLRVDLNYLLNFHSIVSRRIEDPTIYDHLTGTPLNVQSIHYDCDSETIVGDIGKKSIEQKMVEINNLSEAGFEADKGGITLGELVKGKAEELGFDYILP